MKVKSSITLERWNEGGYKEYRIPGIIVTEKGTILCCYEARMSDSSDWAKIDIKLARSTDQGKTFSKKIIVKGPPDRTITYNNPVLIAHEDSVHLIWHQDYSRAFHQVSFDDGETFSEPADITYAFEEFRSRYDWTVIASGPGHGIVLDNGRIIVPVWLAKGRPLVESGRVKEHFPSVVSTIYSDDGGGTWHGGSIISDLDSGNETTAVQLSNGNVLLNMRHRGNQDTAESAFHQTAQIILQKPFMMNRCPIQCASAVCAKPREGKFFLLTVQIMQIMPELI
jgi:sialidase-1